MPRALGTRSGSVALPHWVKTESPRLHGRGGLHMWSGQSVVPVSGPNLHTVKRSERREHSAKGVKLCSDESIPPKASHPVGNQDNVPTQCCEHRFRARLSAPVLANPSQLGQIYRRALATNGAKCGCNRVRKIALHILGPNRRKRFGHRARQSQPTSWRGGSSGQRGPPLPKQKISIHRLGRWFQRASALQDGRPILD